MTSARDDIWIDMVQFDVRVADRLWEGIPPAYGAPGWYDDVSGLIETASGPAERHELVDEPVVVEDMHQTALGRPRRCRHGRTVGRLIAMKAAAATTASVIGVAAAAAATTGIVATVASVVVPVIEEHVLPADDERESATPATPRSVDTGGSPDTQAEDQPIDPALSPPVAQAPPASPQPVDPEPTGASASPVPTAPAVEPAPPPPAVPDAAPPPDPGGVAPTPPPPPDPAPPADAPPVDPLPAGPPATDPAPTDPVVANPPRTDQPVESGPIESASIDSEPAERPQADDPPPAVEPSHAAVRQPAASPPDHVRPDKGQPGRDKRVDADTCGRHACSGRGHHGEHKAAHRYTRAHAIAGLVEQAPAADSRRPG